MGETVFDTEPGSAAAMGGAASTVVDVDESVLGPTGGTNEAEAAVASLIGSRNSGSIDMVRFRAGLLTRTSGSRLRNYPSPRKLYVQLCVASTGVDFVLVQLEVDRSRPPAFSAFGINTKR